MDLELLDPVLWSSVQAQIDADFGPRSTRDLIGDLIPISLESESGKSIYLISMEWMPILKESLGNYELYSIGQLFGEISNGKFALSISILSQLAQLTDSWILISDRATGSFTYGKSILKESVLEMGMNLKKDQKVIVLNENRDCLGVATMTTDGYRVSRMRAEDLVAKNSADIGLYLRKLF